MESTEAGSIEDSFDSKNLEASMEDIVVAKYEDCNSEVLSSQNEDDQGGEQVYGYLEVQNPGSEDATIILDSGGFNLNGQRLILTQNDDGNGIIVVVSEDPDGQPLEQTFAHASVLHPDEVTFEDGLKEHGALVMDEQSQGLEFIETEEVPQEHEERHVYIENSGGIINITNENQCSPINSVNIESPLWTVSNSAQLKNDSTEMLFIPNPTVVLAPEETRHRKLMQLACIAHELQSADQKSNSTGVSEKEAESSLAEFATSVIVTQNELEKHSDETLTEISDEIKDSENAEGLPSDDSNNNHVDSNLKIVSKSVDVSSLLSCTRGIDNAVSVIHTTSSELQDNSLENQTKDNSPTDFSSVKNYNSSESELPSELLYPSRISKVSLHDSLNEEPSNSKPLEGCTREDLEENSQLAIADDSNDSKSARTVAADSELELDCPAVDDDSPITFIEKSQKLDDVDTLGIEDNPLGETEADIRVDDEDSHAGSCIVVVEDDESKEVDEDSHLSSKTGDNFPITENDLSKDSVINQETCLQKEEVPADADSELSTDNDDVSNHKQDASVLKDDLPFSHTKYLYKHKANSKNAYLAENTTLSTEQINETPSDENCTPSVENCTPSEENCTPSEENCAPSDENCMNDLNESARDDNANKTEENSHCEPMDFEDSPTDNLDSELVIAENAEDEESSSIQNECTSVENAPENDISNEALESKSTTSADKESEITTSAEFNFESSKPDTEIAVPADTESVAKEVKNNVNSDEATTSNLDSNTVDDDFSYNEDRLVKTPMKTYIRKKVRDRVVESKLPTKESIELFSVDDINFTECDKDIDDVENSLNSDQLKESVSSSQENNTESDDHLLLSDIQSKVSATYNRKKKSLTPLKQGVRTRNLRPRSLPVKLPLENGNQEISDSESKKNSFDSSSSENIHWADVLLSTSFQPCAETNKDEPSTSFSNQLVTKTSTPLSSQQRKRKLKYTRDFDRLLHSSPVKSKKFKTYTKRQIPRGRKRILKSKQSTLIPSVYSEYLASSDYTSYNVKASTSVVNRKSSRKVKKATIQYLNQNTDKSPDEPLKQEEETFSCSSCTFISKKVNNLIEHLKYCKGKQQPVLTYSVNDMDKRQRIRGEDSTESIEDIAGGCNGAVRGNKRRNSSQGEFSGGCQNQDPEDSSDLDFISNNRKKKKTQYGYGEDDVVWVKYKDRFWPALVCEIRGSKAHVRLIKHPEADKGLKVKHENVRTFDDAKWNCLCLKEAVNLPNNTIFVTSVQSAETFMRRKFLGFDVNGKTFFSVREGVDFATDTASSDSIVDDSDDDEDGVTIRFPPPSRKYRYEKLDKERILGFILEGSLDEYVLDIYNKKLHSDKHKKFFDCTAKLELEHRPWFGPFEEKCEKEDLFYHFRDLFVAKVGDSITDPKFSMTSYVTQVWIPEAVVKAISVVNDIPMEDAENLFESEDSLDMDRDS